MIVDGPLISNMTYCEYKAIQYLVEPRSIKESKARLLARRILGNHTIGEYRFTYTTVTRVIDNIHYKLSPDIIIYRGDRPTAILKAKIRNPPKPYEWDYTQLHVTALLLQDAEDINLILAIAINTGNLIKALESLKRDPTPKPRSGKGWIITTRISDPKIAETIVNRINNIIKGKINPKPTQSKNKCKQCEYKQKCPYTKNTRNNTTPTQRKY